MESFNNESPEEKQRRKLEAQKKLDQKTKYLESKKIVNK